MAACAAEDSAPALEEAADAATYPEGYEMRLDSERSDPAEFQLSETPEGLSIVTGPAGIAWRDEDRVGSGDFRVEATFTQLSAPVGYREAYGIFVGGLDLDGPDREYTYLLVRPTGDFLLKRRRGETTEVLLDWTAHAAVSSVQAEGDEPRNTLAIEVHAEQTRFLVNRSVVFDLPTSEARPYGLAGIRANHRLDIRLHSWTMEAIEPGT
jgi:hypothetical protein